VLNFYEKNKIPGKMMMKGGAKKVATVLMKELMFWER
jgi:hypothetical protein